ncbi:glycosyltransferase involved in cell wall biosynthesis [Cereibacter azotoformans]|uniref:Glycosyltransferase involved in cell wall biosynthesis n=2 Tax=Cereibacter azotoformans TaxID=43057 RepID=A0A2T5JSS0_9RHOB|nr:glycosyltransferase involved in cell wall biosynthesis [Cereibacter azotoformans]
MSLSAEQGLIGHEVRVFGLASKAWTDGDQDRWEGAQPSAFAVRGIPKSFGYAPELAAELTRFDPDVVHLHGLWMYPAFAVLRWHRMTGKPYIYSTHGMLSRVALGFSPIKKRIARLAFQDAALGQAAVLHATAEAEAEEIRSFGLRNPVSVVPLGIKPAVVPPVTPEQAKRVLTIGRIHPVKNLATLIEAWARLECKFPHWTLEIVGPDEGGHLAELQAMATRLEVRQLNFRPAVFGWERDKCMAGADLFVLPTKSENFALTVAESLMMETPVIATRGAPWPGLVRERCGWWIEQGVDPLVDALNAAMSLTDEQRSEMGRRGRAWMLRDYTWRSIADRMLAIYQAATRRSC